MKKDLETLYTPYTLDMYNTFTFENAEESEIDIYNMDHDTGLSYDDFEWEYDLKGYKQAIAENCVKLLQDNIIDDVILNINSDMKVISPKEYNFTTDKIWLDIEYDEVKLDEYINKNKRHYEQEKIRSCDGFIWLGEEQSEKLIYYMEFVSEFVYTQDEYLMDMYEDVCEYEYMSMIKK